MPTQNSFVAYEVSINPRALEISVSMSLTGEVAQGDIRLEMPTWVPGDYEFEPYGRDIFSVQAVDKKTNQALAIARDGFNAYRIASTSDEVSVTYTASCYEPGLGDAMGLVDSDYAILLGTRYLHCPDYTGPCSVDYGDIPAGWNLHHPSGANREASTNCWTYPGFEILLDTPVVFGKFDCFTRSVKETPFYFVFVDRGVGFDQQVEPFIDQLCTAIEHIHDVFGLFPFSDYTFVLSLNPQADWGLEHLTSNMSGLGPDVFVDKDQFANGIRVCVHELFHAWNVRRLRPAPLGQLIHQLSSGCFTEGLWMAEGFTRYYEFLISARANAYSVDKFFSAILGYYQHLSQQPAYTRVSATDSSLATYMNHSKYPGRVNNSIDYYDKGMLIAFGIDAHLRATSTGKNLDNAFKAFYLQFFGDGSTVPPDYVGYTTEDVITFFNEWQSGLGTHVGELVQQPAGLDTLKQFKQLGFTLDWDDSNTLGLFFLNNSEPNIYGVADTGASGQAGIAPGDVITEIDSYAYTPAALQWAATQPHPLQLTVLRGHRRLVFDLTPKPHRKVRSLTWNGSEAQAQLIRQWLNHPDFVPTKGEKFDLSFYENFHGIETMI